MMIRTIHFHLQSYILLFAGYTACVQQVLGASAKFVNQRLEENANKH